MGPEAPGKGLKGNSVQIGSGPAAVNGDEIRKVSHCNAAPQGKAVREGAKSRTIRKPEDLPCARPVLVEMVNPQVDDAFFCIDRSGDFYLIDP
jgi:hypothetical protein